jgi:ankyrin repeat protein
MKNRSSVKILFFMCLLFGIMACQSKKPKTPETSSVTPQKSLNTVEPQANQAQALRDASLEGNTDLVQSILNTISNIDATDEEGHTALMLAAYNGHTPIVKALLGKDAQLNLIDSRGLSALHFASSGPFPETVELLLSHGAQINLPDQIEQFTPLMYAASEGQLDVVKVLLAHDADTSLKDVDGDTAEKFAAQNNHPEIAKLLKSAASK